MDTATHQILGTYMIPDENNANEIMLKRLEVVYEARSYEVFIGFYNNEFYSFQSRLAETVALENIKFYEMIGSKTIKLHLKYIDTQQNHIDRKSCLLPVWMLNVGSLNYVHAQNYINTLDYLLDEDNHNYVLK